MERAQDLLIHDEFEYRERDYELLVWWEAARDDPQHGWQPEAYKGLLRVGPETEVPMGMDRRYEVSYPLEERTGEGIPAGQVEGNVEEIEPEKEPDEIAQYLVDEMADAWENHEVKSLEDIGVEIP